MTAVTTVTKWDVLWCVALLFAGVATAWSWNRMPLQWLCQYGQSIQSVKEKPVLDRHWPLLFFICYLIGALGTLGGKNSELGGEFFLRGFVLFIQWLLLLIALSDFYYTVIPDQLVAGLLALGLLKGLIQGGLREGLALGASGLLCAFSFFLLGVGADAALRMGKKWLRQGEKHRKIRGEDTVDAVDAGEGQAVPLDFSGEGVAFGMGDVKLLLALGAVLGAERGFLVLGAASILNGGVIAVGLSLKRISLKGEHPFGPYLCGCAMAAFLQVQR